MIIDARGGIRVQVQIPPRLLHSFSKYPWYRHESVISVPNHGLNSTVDWALYPWLSDILGKSQL